MSAVHRHHSPYHLQQPTGPAPHHRHIMKDRIAAAAAVAAAVAAKSGGSLDSDRDGREHESLNTRLPASPPHSAHVDRHGRYSASPPGGPASPHSQFAGSEHSGSSSSDETVARNKHYEQIIKQELDRQSEQLSKVTFDIYSSIRTPLFA